MEEAGYLRSPLGMERLLRITTPVKMVLIVALEAISYIPTVYSERKLRYNNEDGLRRLIFIIT